MASEIPHIQFRPVARPVDTVAVDTTFQRLNGPVAPVKPLAPTQAPLLPNPRTGSPAMELMTALSGFSKSVSEFLGSWEDETNKKEKTDGEFSAMSSSASSWADAVQKDPSLASKSPWFQKAFKERIATTSMERRIGELQAEYYNSDIKNSTDPAAIQRWYMERVKPTLDALSDPNERRVALDAATKQASAFATAHAANASQNILKKNQQSFGDGVSQILDGSARTPGALYGSGKPGTGYGSMRGDPAQLRNIPADQRERYANAIRATAAEIGADPHDLATVISFESRFSTSIWGGAKDAAGNPKHMGIIQFGAAEREKYGAHDKQSIEEQLAAAARYFKDRGYRPGMGLLDLYSTVNAGRPGLYDRSDTANGGTPGTVLDKVQKQFGSHREAAVALLGARGEGDAPSAPAATGPAPKLDPSSTERLTAAVTAEPNRPVTQLLGAKDWADHETFFTGPDGKPLTAAAAAAKIKAASQAPAPARPEIDPRDSATSAKIGTLYSHYRTQGIDEKQAATDTVDAVVNHALKNRDPSQLKLLDFPLPDGRVLSQDPQVRHKVMQAENSIRSLQVQETNQRVMLASKEKELAKENLKRSVFLNVLDAIRQKKDPTIPQDVMERATAMDPDLFTSFTAINKNLAEQAKQEDPSTINELGRMLYSGRATVDDVQAWFREGHIRDPQTLLRFYNEAQDNEGKSFLTQPLLQRAMGAMEGMLNDPGKYDPEKRMKSIQAQQLLREEFKAFMEQNHRASLLQQDDFLQKTSRVVLSRFLEEVPAEWKDGTIAPLPATPGATQRPSAPTAPTMPARPGTPSTAPVVAPPPQPAGMLPAWRTTSTFKTNDEFTKAYDQYRTTRSGPLKDAMDKFGVDQSTTTSVAAFVKAQSMLLADRMRREQNPR